MDTGIPVEPRHTDPMGICHGGMMASFCDRLLPLVAHRKVPEIGRQFLPTISLQIGYLAPSVTGFWVQGEAQVPCTTRPTGSACFRCDAPLEPCP
ncbi:MAG: PaaI family thioesterase [Burkholderiaceae bacterium]|nr:PaaI family thioesterase [Burkholderiaceae bacterium]